MLDAGLYMSNFLEILDHSQFIESSLASFILVKSVARILYYATWLYIDLELHLLKKWDFVLVVKLDFPAIYFIYCLSSIAHKKGNIWGRSWIIFLQFFILSLKVNLLIHWVKCLVFSQDLRIRTRENCLHNVLWQK